MEKVTGREDVDVQSLGLNVDEVIEEGEGAERATMANPANWEELMDTDGLRFRWNTDLVPNHLTESSLRLKHN